MSMNVQKSDSTKCYNSIACRIVCMGVLLGFVYGAIAGLSHLAAQRYLQLGLYRLAAVEFNTILLHSICFLAGTVVAASLTSWLLRYLADRFAARYRLKKRHLWLIAVVGLLLLIGLILIALAVVDMGSIVEWLKTSQASPFLKWLFHFWQEADYPSHFGAVVFILSVLMAPVLRRPVNRQADVSLFEKLFMKCKVRLLAATAVILTVLMVGGITWDRLAHKVKGHNVVLITIDTLRADHLSCYGYRRNTSPAIDKLAENGVLFWNAFSPANWTLPSVSSIQTALYPFEHGAVTRDRRFPDSCVTLAEVMRNAGYRTMAVVSHYFVGRKYGFEQGFDVFDQTHMAGHDAVTSQGITESAVQLLQTSGDRPFFLWLHYFDPHYTYIRHKEYNFAADYHGSLPTQLRHKDLSSAKQDLTPEDLQYVRDVYDEEIAYTDQWVGRLIQAIHDFGLQDNTLVILTADHGEEFMERGDFGHHSKLYNELIHVPLIIAGALEPALQGRIVKDGVEMRNVAKTILGDCGVESDEIHGTSLLRDAESEADAVPCFSTATNPGEVEDRKLAVIDNGHKLIWYFRESRYELYDLRNDPYERTNILDDEPEVVQGLKKLLEEKMQGFIKRNGRDVRYLRFRKDELRYLRSLGYVE